MESLTQTIHVKHAFDDKEMLTLSRQMAGAEATISRKMEELKSVTTTIKADIASQEGVLHSCAEKLRSGYEMRPIECDVHYEKGIVKFIDRQTGEVVEERSMTQEEQLRLSEHRVDAESVIREASREED